MPGHCSAIRTRRPCCRRCWESSSTCGRPRRWPRRPPRKPARPAGRRIPAATADTASLERRLTEALGYKVEVVMERGAGGTVRIQFEDLHQLSELTERLAG